MELSKSLPAQLPKLRFLDRFMAGHAGYIAGGCFKNLFLGEKIKDVDIFFVTEKDCLSAIAYFEGNIDYIKGFTNDRVTRFKDTLTGLTVELITPFMNEPLEIIERFDFTITKAVYSRDEEGAYVFHCHHKFFEHLMNKKLVIDDQILFPLSTFNRVLKYTRYGFGLCGESKEKLIASLQGAVVTTQNDFYFGID